MGRGPPDWLLSLIYLEILSSEPVRSPAASTEHFWGDPGYHWQGYLDVGEILEPMGLS